MNVVTVFQKCAPRKKKQDGEIYHFLESSAMETTSSMSAVSVDLAPHLKEGILLCGEYDLEGYDCMIELSCPKDIIYIACPSVKNVPRAAEVDAEAQDGTGTGVRSRLKMGERT